jgi:hypothetical protein
MSFSRKTRKGYRPAPLPVRLTQIIPKSLLSGEISNGWFNANFLQSETYTQCGGVIKVIIYTEVPLGFK